MFDEQAYTEDSIIKQLLLIQAHASDGSAVDGGCTCIQDKHLTILEGLSEEGMTIMADEKKKQFYADVADMVRKLRKTIVSEEYELPHNPITSGSGHVKSCEEKIEKCVLQVKEEGSDVNPYAVCHSRIKCP